MKDLERPLESMRGMDAKSRTFELSGLNPEQEKAVCLMDSHLRILAGAGSGKTRVLVQRMAYLIKHHRVSPMALLAVTFTNKAAREMQGRLESLVSVPVRSLWVGTFHGLCYRMLQMHWREANLAQEFQVLDSDDQLRIVKQVIKQLHLDEKQWQPKQAMWFINKKKDDGIRACHLESAGDPFNDTMISIYRQYELICQQQKLVDFAELLLASYELLRDKDEVRQYYHQRFKYLLVDEFQDTNTIQYAWLQIITSPSSFVTVVGDDDQSIYGWRGAQISHIQNFTEYFTPATTIRLEQNYRSTQTILEAANAVIDNNTGRLGKKLWTDGDKGDAISLYHAYNDRDESRHAVSLVEKYRDQGLRLSEMAILYRSNAQSRVLEEAFLRAGIPYRIYGGQRFFERAEIKDALAYLRLIYRPDDSQAFERVVNWPTRGIGNKTVDIVRDKARESDFSLWQASEFVLEHGILTKRASESLIKFMELIKDGQSKMHALPLVELVSWVIEKSGLLSHYRKEKGVKGEGRIDNLNELISACSRFEPFGATPAYSENSQEPLSLGEFLAYTVLESGDNQAPDHEDCVQMMTMHSAKGLEFPMVFVSGMEEGMFPHQMSMQGVDDLEEERRLCYVAMTRAMKYLHLSYAESRRLRGQDFRQQASRFISEVPKELIKPVRIEESVSFSVSDSGNSEEGGISLGQRVSHTKFGEGTVINTEGSGDNLRLQVAFDEGEPKWLVMAFARLTLL